jgi:hypothetical protein
MMCSAAPSESSVLVMLDFVLTVLHSRVDNVKIRIVAGLIKLMNPLMPDANEKHGQGWRTVQHRQYDRRMKDQ